MLHLKWFWQLLVHVQTIVDWTKFNWQNDAHNFLGFKLVFSNQFYLTIFIISWTVTKEWFVCSGWWQFARRPTVPERSRRHRGCQPTATASGEKRSGVLGPWGVHTRLFSGKDTRVYTWYTHSYSQVSTHMAVHTRLFLGKDISGCTHTAVLR